MTELKEEPCPHCGTDLRLPPECTLEVWEQLHEERDDARTERDQAREEIARLTGLHAEAWDEAVRASAERDAAVGALTSIGQAVDDSLVPSDGDEDAAEKWERIATERKKKARQAVAQLPNAALRARLVDDVVSAARAMRDSEDWDALREAERMRAALAALDRHDQGAGGGGEG